MKLPYTYPTLVGNWENCRRVVADFFQRTANAVNNPDFGTTAQRPTGTATLPLTVGQFYLDTTLNKPVWWTVAGWRDATGALV